MGWRIVEKAGLPGWAGRGAILLTLTGIGTIVPLVLLWVSPSCAGRATNRAGRRATRRIPRHAPGTPRRRRPDGARVALADRRGWRLSGPRRRGACAAIDGAPEAYLSPARRGPPADLSVPDPSVGQPHARLLTARGRFGLEDLGSPGGTFIDGARLLPSTARATSARRARSGSAPSSSPCRGLTPRNSL